MACQELLVIPSCGTIGYMQREKQLMAFAARLNQLCDQKGLPKEGGRRQAALGKIFGVSYQAARKWLDAEGFPAIKMGSRIAAWGDVSFDWLMTGNGIVLQNAATDLRAGFEITSKALPKYADAMLAKAPTQVPVVEVGTKVGDQVQKIDLWADVRTSDPDAFVVRVPDGLMYPKYRSGDYVLIEPEVAPEIEDDVLVVLHDGRVLLRMLGAKKGGIRLVAFASQEVVIFMPEEIKYMYWVAHSVPLRNLHTRIKP